MKEKQFLRVQYTIHPNKTKSSYPKFGLQMTKMMWITVTGDVATIPTSQLSVIYQVQMSNYTTVLERGYYPVKSGFFGLFTPRHKTFQ